MRTHSLRLRLLLIWALAIACSLSLAGVALVTLFSLHVERVVVGRLTDDLNRLAALVDADAEAITVSQPMTDPRFDVPLGGRYWQIRDPASGQIETSRSTWDQVLDLGGQPIASVAPTELRIRDPEGAIAIAVARTLAFERNDGTTRTLVLVAAEDSAETDLAVAAYRNNLVVALGVLAVILSGAAWAQVTLGLAPLAAIRRGVSAIRAGQTQTLAGEFPTEVMPLVNEVNELTRVQEFSIQFARQRASDLAHGLKGHLQVLVNVANDMRAAGHFEAAQEIEAAATAMNETVDHQLGLSRLRRRVAKGGAGTDLRGAADSIVRTLSKSSYGNTLAWRIDISADAAVVLDRSDLNELLGALIENAGQWAATAVSIHAERRNDVTVLDVDDDGPGLSDAQISKLGARGVRLDERRSGSGIGLSIAREIVGINGGSLEFSRSTMGGLHVRVTLPAPVIRLAPAAAAD